MLALSSTDVAIRRALELDTLKIERSVNRFGEKYFAICDDHGLIEIASNERELESRVGLSTTLLLDLFGV